MKKSILSFMVILSLLFPITGYSENTGDLGNNTQLSEEESGSLWWLAEGGAVLGLGTLGIIVSHQCLKIGKAWGRFGGKSLRATGLVIGGLTTLALAIYFGPRAKRFLLSQVDKDLLEKHFVDMKVAKAQWEVSPENPFLKSNYLVEKKLYQEKTLELAVLSGFEGRREVLDQIENQILETESELLVVDSDISGMSPQDSIAFLADKGSVPFDQEEQRVEIAQRYREALAILEGAI